MSIANTIIRLKRSEVSGNVPTSLDSGEIAINTADGLLFYKDPSNIIKSISTGSRTNSFSTINVSSTLLIATSNNDILSIGGNGSIFVTGDEFTDTITINVNDGTTSQKGVVQLYNGTDSTSTSLAATANSVNAVHKLANTAYYLALDANTGGGGGSILTSSYKVQEYVATSGQTTFVVDNGYQKNNVEVFVNGILLDSSDYNANSGISVILNAGATLGDNVSIAKWYFDNSIYLTAQQRFDEFVATNNQTLFVSTGTYTPGYIKIFRNGILLENSEFTANNGANVTLTHAATANDIVTLNYWGAEYIDATPVFILANNAWNASNAVYNMANTALNTSNSVYSIASDAANTANLALASVSSKMQGLEHANITSVMVSTSNNSTNQLLDYFSTSNYRSVKYQVQVTSSTDYQISEISLIHDGTNSYLTEYGLITTSGTLISYDTDISGGNARLLMNPVNNINTIKLVKTSIVV